MGQVVEIAVEQMLRDWALWSRQGRPNPKGAQSWLGKMIDRKLQRERGASPIYPESRIDDFDRKVMLFIKLNSPKTYEALDSYYGDPRVTAEDIARWFGIRKQTACDLLNLGREMVAELAAEQGIKIA